MRRRNISKSIILTLGDGSPGVELVPVVVEVDASLSVDLHVATEAARQPAVVQLPLLVEQILVVPWRGDDVRHVRMVPAYTYFSAAAPQAHEHVLTALYTQPPTVTPQWRRRGVTVQVPRDDGKAGKVFPSPATFGGPPALKNICCYMFGSNRNWTYVIFDLCHCGGILKIFLGTVLSPDTAPLKAPLRLWRDCHRDVSATSCSAAECQNNETSTFFKNTKYQNLNTKWNLAIKCVN